jgi:hypothetical protein
MSTPMSKFTKRLRHKMHEIEHRLDALQTATEAQAEKADKAIHAHAKTLEDSAKSAKQMLAGAQEDVVSWVDDAKDTVSEWKARLDTRMLQGRADRAERYAEATLVVALDGVDKAERAMLCATTARNDAVAAHTA